VAQFDQLPVGKAYTCWPVVTEAAYLTRYYPRQRDELFDSIAAGQFPLLSLDERDVAGIQHVLRKYVDQQIDLADAALVHLARREGIHAILTFDRRHFTLFRRNDGQPFRLLPEMT
jgi:predicted nucleic acid-binding protein